MSAHPRILERTRAVWDRVRSHPPDVHAHLPVKPDEIAAALDALDDARIVAAFATEIGDALRAANKPGATAVKWEWYAGARGRHDTHALGVVATQCVVRGYANTDLVKIAGIPIERDEPELDDVDACGGFDLDRVMASWYGELGRRFDGFDYTPILNTPAHAPFNEAENAFHELFKLKLAALVARALDDVAGAPAFAFLGTHERWPMLLRGAAD